MERTIYLLTAWKTTGKDTFFKDLFQNPTPIYEKWLFYKRYNTTTPLQISPQSCKRYAFATTLKNEVHQLLGIEGYPRFLWPFISLIHVLDWMVFQSHEPTMFPILRSTLFNIVHLLIFPFENHVDGRWKEHLYMSFPYPSLHIQSLRNHYVRYADYQLKLNTNHFVQQVVNQIVSDKNISSIVITDWRHVHEYEFIKQYIEQHHLPWKIVTIRLFREEVPIPDASEKSEHNLDNFQTDQVLVSKQTTHISSLRALLPNACQYHAWYSPTIDK